MFAGHIGAAMAIGRAERRINVGLFVFAAVLLDFVLWILVLCGWETVTIPADYARTHQPQFVFPYSHGLLASLAWSAAAGALAFLVFSRHKAARLRAAVLVAAAVFSHWVLDAIVHVAEMPLAGAASTKVGLGLWNSMPVALALEAAIAAAGLWLFLSGARISRSKKIGLALLALVILGSTIAGMTLAPPPPSVTTMAATSLAIIVVVCALATWLDKPSAG